MSIQFIDHTADIQFRASGSTISDAFNEAAKAYSQYVMGGSTRKKPTLRKKISLTGPSVEHLLCAFLNELVFFMEHEGFVVISSKIKVNKGKLTGELFGVDVSAVPSLSIVKAATYADLYVKQLASGRWEVQIVLDV